MRIHITVAEDGKAEQVLIRIKPSYAQRLDKLVAHSPFSTRQDYIRYLMQRELDRLETVQAEAEPQEK